ncbi:MAG: site-2 protease family protein [Verrucomicrobia bacterium]|nr:site-2 protease family protein [Verrucomicrobiota bacterium]MBR5606479.1 site-2 protease family protein [Verrucomicrobiota bacterium]
MLVDGIILYLCFLISLSFHECAHAWMAQRCGDSTAKLLGRLTLNPLAHIDMLGTVIIPALMIFLPLLGSSAAALSGFIIGWARPVPVNPNNFRNYRRDDNLVSLAGPVSNLLLGFAILVIIRLMSLIPIENGSFLAQFMHVLLNLTFINILLAWFNLVPVPPLDGSHLLKNFTNMGWETYMWLSRYGIIILILALNFTPLQDILRKLISYTFMGMTFLLRF